MTPHRPAPLHLAAGELRLVLSRAPDLNEVPRPPLEQGKIRYPRPRGGMPLLQTPKLAAEYLIQYCTGTGELDDPREHAYVLACNTKQRLLTDPYLLAIGAMSTCQFSVAEVYRYALAIGASSVIVAHTHPSGDVEPSAEDTQITRRVQMARDIFGIPVLDHVILAGCHRTVESRGYFSFQERGLL